MENNFFNQINFSSANEDGQSELTALRLTNTDDVVCITGSGARPMGLLTACPRKIYSVDFNPTQNHLLTLKLAANQQLSYEEFREFIGIDSSEHRIELFSRIENELPESTRRFWSESRKKIASGVLYCGTWEKLLQLMSKTTILRKRRIEELWHASDLQHQTTIWEKHWDNGFLKSLLKLISTRFVWTSIIREPGAKLIPKNFAVGEYIYQSIKQLVRHSLIRENPWANLLFRGEYTPSCLLPIHLREEHFETIRDNVQRIEIVTSPLAEFLLQNPNSFSAFSLSDFASYAPVSQYNEIWQSVIKSAQPGARYCERFFLVKRDQIPNQIGKASWEKSVDRDRELESSIAKNDHTCLYSFRAGQIYPP